MPAKARFKRFIAQFLFFISFIGCQNSSAFHWSPSSLTPFRPNGASSIYPTGSADVADEAEDDDALDARFRDVAGV
jgi:hypothetical protein